MLSNNDLSKFIAQLPKDLNLIVENRKYAVNKQVVSTLSVFLSNKFQEDESVDTIILDVSDDHKVFSTVITFLNGGKINIAPDNDYPIDLFATFLDIPSLRQLTQKSLNLPLSVSNILQRYSFYQINNNEENPKYQEFFSYFEDNIESIIQYQQIRNKNSTKIFEVDPLFLSKIIHSDKSKFASLSNRYLFALDCCVYFYSSFVQQEKSLNIFISQDDLEKMPDDVIIQMCSNEKFWILETEVPALKLAQQLISEILRLQQEINETNEQNTQIELEIAKIHEDNEAIMKNQMSSEAKLNEVGRRKYDMSNILSRSATNITQKAPELTEFIIPNSIIPEIESILGNLDQKTSNLKKVLIKISVTKLIFADLRAKGLKLTEKFEELLAPMNQLLSAIVPNEDSINQLIEQLRMISKQLFSMADDLYTE